MEPAAFAFTTTAAAFAAAGAAASGLMAGRGTCCRQVPMRIALCDRKLALCRCTTCVRTTTSCSCPWDRRRRRSVQRLKQAPLLAYPNAAAGLGLGLGRLVEPAMTTRIICCRWAAAAALALALARGRRRRRWGQILVVGPRMVRSTAGAASRTGRRRIGRRPRRGGGAAAAATVRRATRISCVGRCIPPSTSSGTNSSCST